MDQKFYYRARDKQGRLTKGYLCANSLDEALMGLKEKDLFVTSLREKNVEKLKSSYFKWRISKLGARELSAFSRQFAEMIKAGVPLVESLETLAHQLELSALRKALDKAVRALKEGKSLKEALQESGGIFPELYISMIGAGEKSGTLEKIITRLALYYEREMELQKKIKKAVIYPTILISSSLVVLYLLVTYILPEFVLIFRGMEAELPFVTLLVLELGEIIRFNAGIILLCFIIFYLFFRLGVKTCPGKRKFDLLKLKVPVLKNIFLYLTLSRFSRTFSILIKSGVNITETLELVRQNVNNKIIEELIEVSINNVKNGYSFSIPFNKSKFIPPILKKMIAVGEETGSLDVMMENTADYFEIENKYNLDNLCSLIEPVLIFIMMLFIGFIVISVVSPMLEMWQVF